MKKPINKEMSVVSRGARYRFGIACAMITIMPALVLCYQFYGDISRELVSDWKFAVLAFVLLVMVCLGWIVLYRYPFTIIRLRKYLESVVRGQIPESIHLLHSEDDMVAIEKGFNMLLDRLTMRVENMEKEILEISEREQRVIGQNLHDGLGQHLSGIAFKAKALEKQLSDKSLPESEEVLEIRHLVGEALEQAKSLSKGLCPVRMGANGLMAALEDLCVGAEKMFGITCNVLVTPDLVVVDEKASHIYRIAQEALTNAVKHGNAKKVEICLKEQDGHVSLVIEDNGSGMTPVHDSQGKQGMGLGIMKYRASRIGAVLDIGESDHGGIRISCSFEL